MSTPVIGLGDIKSPWLNVYIANRPPLDEYVYLDELVPLKLGVIAYIAQETGNHWRKIFNVYSKLIFSYYEYNKKTLKSDTWQQFRDKELLQQESGLRLLFSAPNLQGKGIHLIMGKQYATDLGYQPNDHEGMIQLDGDFSVWPDKNVIVCPYFDYRQLSNAKISKLIEIIMTLPVHQDPSKHDLKS